MRGGFSRPLGYNINLLDQYVKCFFEFFSKNFLSNLATIEKYTTKGNKKFCELTVFNRFSVVKLQCKIRLLNDQAQRKSAVFIMEKTTTKSRSWDKARTEKSTRAIHEKMERQKIQDEKHSEHLKRQGRPHKYTSGLCFAYKIAKYFYDQDNTINENDKSMPYTLTGLNIATGTDLNKYYDGSRDHINDEHIKLTDNGVYIETDIYNKEKAFIYDCENIPELAHYICRLYDNTDYNAIHFSNICKKARQIVEEQAEQRLYIKGRVADIFTMKSRYNWQEENKTTHTIEIATSDQARERLKALDLLE